MALQPATGLETHPAGTIGLNGIIDGNWQRLEAIFAAMETAGPDDAFFWDATGKTFTRRTAQSALTYAGTTNIDLAAALTQTLALTGNLTLTTSNRAAGRRVSVVITADASLRTLTFPAWKFLGAAAPADIAAGKTGLLELHSTGTTDAAVIAHWTVEP